jgi:hypothetical protein
VILPPVFIPVYRYHPSGATIHWFLYGFDLVFIVYVFMVHKWHQTKPKYNQMFMIIEIIEESLGFFEPPFWICKWANHLSFLAMNNPLPVWFYHQFLYLYIVTTLVVQQYIDFYLYFHYFDLWIQAEFYLRNIRYGFDLVFIVYVFMVHKWHQTKKVFLIIPV